MVSCRFCDTPFLDATYLDDKGVCGSEVCQDKYSKTLRKYRKKPVIIEAEGPITDGRVIKTLEGDMIASPGDFIITGVQGEQYPCKPDIFHATYEPVGEDT